MNRIRLAASLGLLLAFSMPQNTFAQRASSARGDRIGAPKDGVTYTVVLTRKATKAVAARCGYNDLGLPNIGIFRVELREYTAMRNGRPVRTWRETVEVFDGCHNP